MRLLTLRWLTLVCLSIATFISCVLFAASTYSQTPQCFHGMRIVGEKSSYLSHMPLFGSACHGYQILLEATFEGPGNPQAKYLKDQKKDFNKNVYTLEPTEKFWLPGLESGKIKSFKANIHRGQYEGRTPQEKQETQLIASNVTVNVKRVLHFRKLDPKAQPFKLTEYLLFGNSGEQYLAHLISAPPDFDQILAVKTRLPLVDTQLTKAVRLVLPNRPIPNSKQKMQQALKPNDTPQVLINGSGSPQAVTAGMEYFVETADLNK